MLRGVDAEWFPDVALRRLTLAAAWCWIAASSAPLAAADARLPDFLNITQLDAAAAREIVSQQAAKPSLAKAAPWSHAWQDAVLLRAGATREELARLRLDLEAACGRERRGMDVREFLSLTRQPEWRRMANRVADCLHLPAVTRLTPEVAAQLAHHRGAIALAGLTEIDGATSAAIAAAPGPLDLGGLTSLSPEVAAALAAHAGPLHLGGLESLTPDAARELAAYRGAWLDVSGLTSLSVEAARALANCTGRWNGRLPSLRTLSAEAAGELARSRMPLDLRGLRALTSDAAEALAREAVALNLDGLATLEPGVAGKLAEFQGPLSVAGLADIGPAVAESLVRCRDWNGWLPRVKALSPPIAEILATRRGNLTLSGLAMISEESARAIAARPGGGLWLDGLEALPPEVARAIGDRSRGDFLSIRLPPNPEPASVAAVVRRVGAVTVCGLDRLTPDVAAALTDHHHKIMFADLERLEPEAAAALAPKYGTIYLPALRTIDLPTAQALARGRSMAHLYGLVSADADVVDFLAARQGDIRFNLAVVDSLSIERAVWFAGWGGDVELPRVETLDGPDATAIAEAIVAKSGPFGLPCLRRIAKPALEVLRQKSDIRLPPSEWLEVVAGGAP